MSVSKVIVGISIVCGVALTLFIWMPLFALGGLMGIASSFFGDGFQWYGRLYADRDEEYLKEMKPQLLPPPEMASDSGLSLGGRALGSLGLPGQPFLADVAQ